MAFWIGCLVIRTTIAMADLASAIKVKYGRMITVYIRKIPKETQEFWVEMTKGGRNQEHHQEAMMKVLRVFVPLVRPTVARCFTICFTICLCISPDFDGNRGTKNETLCPERPTKGPETQIRSHRTAGAFKHRLP
jgi:hypothetical protein